MQGLILTYENRLEESEGLKNWTAKLLYILNHGDLLKEFACIGPIIRQIWLLSITI